MTRESDPSTQTRRRRAEAGGQSAAASTGGGGAARTTAVSANIQLLSRAMFWKPRHADKARSLGHAPFLFWLVETLRPLQVVQIGLEDPSSYLTLCQALDKLGIESLALGVEAEPTKLAVKAGTSAEHDLLYGDFSALTTEPIDRAPLQLSDNPVDLLVIDTTLTPELLSLLRAHWLPRLSERSVLLIHCPEVYLAAPEARQFLEDMRGSRPNVSLNWGSPGLEVLLFGAEQAGPLLHFAKLKPGIPEYLLIRQVFIQLGQGLKNGQLAQNQRAALAEAEATRKDLERQLADLQISLDDERQAKSRAQITALEAERDGLLASHKTATQELAALARIAENHRREAAAVERRNNQIQREVSELQRHLEHSRAEVVALRASSSWRITAPLRKLFGRRH